MSVTCFACGKRHRAANYCPHCGTDLSPENRRHFEVMRSHDDAARKAVMQAKEFRDVYANVDGVELPPLRRLIPAMAAHVAGQKARPRGLWDTKVVEMALDYYQRRDDL